MAVVVSAKAETEACKGCGRMFDSDISDADAWVRRFGFLLCPNCWHVHRDRLALQRDDKELEAE